MEMESEDARAVWFSTYTGHQSVASPKSVAGDMAAAPVVHICTAKAKG
jgi:hypothetical protein